MRYFIIILAVITQTACAPYLVASTGVTLTTGKSLADHALTQTTGYDCSSFDLIYNNSTHSYYCEKPREPGTTYNRNPI